MPVLSSAYITVVGTLRTPFLCAGLTGASVAGVLAVVVATGVKGCAIGGWIVEVGVAGFSLEHPTATEQTIRIPANTSVLMVFSKLLVLRAELKLMPVMVGHLLLLSSTQEGARAAPQ